MFVLASSLFPLKYPDLHNVIQVSPLALYILHIHLVAAQLQMPCGHSSRFVHW